MLGEKVSYWSDTHKQWMDALVAKQNIGPHGAVTSYELDVKRGAFASRMRKQEGNAVKAAEAAAQAAAAEAANAEAKSKAAKAAAEKAALAAAKAATAEAAAKRRRIGAGGAALVARLEAEAAAKAAAKATAMAELQRRLRRVPPPLAIYRTPRCMYSMHLCK